MGFGCCGCRMVDLFMLAWCASSDQFLHLAIVWMKLFPCHPMLFIYPVHFHVPLTINVYFSENLCEYDPPHVSLNQPDAATHKQIFWGPPNHPHHFIHALLHHAIDILYVCIPSQISSIILRISLQLPSECFIRVMIPTIVNNNFAIYPKCQLSYNFFIN